MTDKVKKDEAANQHLKNSNQTNVAPVNKVARLFGGLTGKAVTGLTKGQKAREKAAGL